MIYGNPDTSSHIIDEITNSSIEPAVMIFNKWESNVGSADPSNGCHNVGRSEASSKDQKVVPEGETVDAFLRCIYLRRLMRGRSASLFHLRKISQRQISTRARATVPCLTLHPPSGVGEHPSLSTRPSACISCSPLACRINSLYAVEQGTPS